MVSVLKKEMAKTNNKNELEDMDKYRQLLVRGLHHLSIKFPDIAITIIPVVVEFLSDSNELAANDVLVFIREMIQKYSHLKEILLQKLLEIYPSVKSIKILRGILWILGEYCESVEDIQTLITLIRQSLGDLPIVDDELKRASGEYEANKSDEQILQSNIGSTPSNAAKLVTADGTYASQSAFVMNSTASNAQNGTSSKDDSEKRPTFRGFLLQGHFFIAVALSRTLTKLALKYIALKEGQQVKQNRFSAEAMLIMACILHYGKSGLPKKPITEDDCDSIYVCLRVLSEHTPFAVNLFKDKPRVILTEMLQAKLQEQSEQEGNLLSTKKRSVAKLIIQADDPLRFGQLMTVGDFSEKEDVFDLTLKQAIGVLNKKDEDFILGSKLNKVTQLTGFSDPVYAEAYVHVHQFDIVLDVLIVNQTSDTLQSLTLELATLGDLKLVEKPMSLTLAPRDFTNIKANIKVASTENGKSLF
jgi:coatomer subunit beta